VADRLADPGVPAGWDGELDPGLARPLSEHDPSDHLAVPPSRADLRAGARGRGRRGASDSGSPPRVRRSGRRGSPRVATDCARGHALADGCEAVVRSRRGFSVLAALRGRHRPPSMTHSVPVAAADRGVRGWWYGADGGPWAVASVVVRPVGFFYMR